MVIVRKVLLAKFSEQKEGRGSGGHNKVDYIIYVDTAKHFLLASQTPMAVN